MDVSSTLAKMFPGGTVHGGQPGTGGFFQVFGLTPDTAPKNCEVVAHRQSKLAGGLERRESYLAKTAEFVLFFSICEAAPDSGYGEFVMGRACPLTDQAKVQALQAYAHTRL